MGLSMHCSPNFSQKWSRTIGLGLQMRSRLAHRILFERILPMLETWPTRLSTWFDALPSAISSSRVARSAPDSGTSWVETRKAGPWPPRQFLGRDRRRMADQLLITTLAWTLVRLARIRADALKLVPDIDMQVSRQLDVAIRVSDSTIVSQAAPIRPSEQELRILGREGKSVERRVSRRPRGETPRHLAECTRRRAPAPDPEIRWRLFHLSILGIVLIGARNIGAKVTATAPLTRSSGSAAFRILTEDGLSWDLWFEGETAWSAYGRSSPYLEVTKKLGGGQRPLSPDLLLVRGDNYAVSIECKYSQILIINVRGYEKRWRTRLILQVISPVPLIRC